jgi:hypothetical protein
MCSKEPPQSEKRYAGEGEEETDKRGLQGSKSEQSAERKARIEKTHDQHEKLKQHKISINNTKWESSDKESDETSSSESEESKQPRKKPRIDKNENKPNREPTKSTRRVYLDSSSSEDEESVEEEEDEEEVNEETKEKDSQTKQQRNMTTKTRQARKPDRYQPGKINKRQNKEPRKSGQTNKEMKQQTIKWRKKTNQKKTKRKSIVNPYPTAKKPNNETKKNRPRQHQTKLEEPKSSENMEWGDSFDEQCEKGVVRIYFQNLNGIKKADDYKDAHEIAFALSKNQVQIAGFAETLLDWRIPGVQKAVLRQIRNGNQSKTIKLTTSNARESATNTANLTNVKQRGGTAMYVRGKWAYRVKEKGEDSTGMGRWSYQTLGNKEIYLTIITAYQVCDKNTVEANSTAYDQQWRMIREKGTKIPDPRKEFRQDLRKFIDNLRHKGHEVWLMMDANENLNDAKSQLRKTLMECGMSDVHTKRHDPESAPATHNRGTKTIDYQWATEDIKAHIARTGILPFHALAGIFTDHRGSFADVDLDTFFKSEAPEPREQEQRQFQSTDPETVKKYRETAMEYWEEHAMDQRIELLRQLCRENMKDKEIPALMEKLDKDLTRCMETAGNSVAKKKNMEPWSPTLMKAKRTEEYWKKTFSQVNTGKDLSKQREEIVKKHGLEIEEPANLTAKATRGTDNTKRNKTKSKRTSIREPRKTSASTDDDR